MVFLRIVSMACIVFAAHICFSAVNFVADSFEINDGGEAGPIAYYKAETNGNGIVNSPWSPLFQGYSISMGIDTSMFPLNNLRRPMSSYHGLTTNQVLSVSPYTSELKRAVVGTFDAQGSLTGSGASCSGGAHVYLDLLTQFGEGMATTPDELTKLQSAQVKAAFFVSTNGNLIVYSLAGFSEIHTMPVNGENWYRLTIEMQTAEVEAISNLLFRVYRDAEPVLSSDALTEALLPGTTEKPGVWFKAAVQNDFRVKAVGFDGEGAVDELVVSDASPNLGTNTTHTVQISTGGAGAGTTDPSGLITVPDGWNKSLTITPDPESRVQDILLDGQSTGVTNTTYTLSSILSNTLVEVLFSMKQYTVTVSKGGTGDGAISPSGVISVDSGATLTLTNAPNAESRVSAIRVDGVSTGETNGIFTLSNIRSNRTYEVIFERIPHYAITVNTSGTGSGTVSPSGPVDLQEGGSQTFIIAPAVGSRIQDIKLDSLSTGQKGTSFTVENVLSNRTLEIVFELIPSYTITLSKSGTGTGAIAPAGPVVSVQEGSDQTFSFTPDANSFVNNVLVDGLSMGSDASYSFNNVTNSHVLQVEFKLTGSAMTFTGRVTNASGTAIPNATVVFKTSTNGLPIAQVLTTSQGYYTYTVNNTTSNYFVCASKTGYRISTNALVGAGFSLRADFVLAASRNIPKMHYLLFAVEGDSLGVPDSTANWPLLYSTYPYENLASMQVMGQPPVVEYLGAKYSNNRRSGGDGYRLNRIEAAQGQTIPVEGVTITTLVRPLRNTTSDSWDSVVDFYYDNLRFMIQNSTGQVSVRRNTGQNNTGTIPDGQLTILSLVLQTNGTYEVWSRAYNTATKNFNAAARIGNITAQSPFVAFTPKQSGTEGFKGWINIGRNNPDGWSTFNGYIGDTFVYRTALTATERGELEADIAARVVAALDTIRTVTVTSQGTGTVTPSGAIVVKRGSSQSFLAVPAYGYALASITTNGVSIGAVSSPWVLQNVQTDIALHVTFSALPTRTISGRVMDAAGQPVSGALVQVRAQDGTLTGITTLTDSAGFYSISIPNVEGSLFITKEDVGVQVIALIANGSQTHNATLAVSSGIQCRWNFDSNLLDSVAGRLASYSGAAPLVYSADAKKVALAGGLKGTAAIILPQGSVPTASTNEMTIEIWAKKTALHNGSRIFDFGTSLGSHLAMVWQQGAGEAVGTRYYIAATVKPGAGAYGETLFTLYRKNLSTSATTIASGSSSWTLEALAGANLFIGRSVWEDNDAGAEYDELRIYDRALTQAEMQVNSLAGPDVCPEFPSLTFDCAEGPPGLRPYLFGGTLNLNDLDCTVLNGHLLAPGTYTLMTAPNGTLQGLPTLTGLGGYWKLVNNNGALKLVFDPGSILMLL
jgi:hypothetical protein